ncbi:hypothetical protein C0J52_20501 [Blattella germanica]|nr:hypothetical protein C0J52_20501 [Blattella germanica]
MYRMKLFGMLVLLGLLSENVSSSCPWLCICFLKEIPITANCSGVELQNFPLQIDPRVQWIDLKDNKVTIVPSLDRYTELEVLELSGNRIGKISMTTFRKLSKLKYLDLSNNSFTDWSQVNLQSLLLSARSLKTLKLSYNSLKVFTGLDGKVSLKSSSLEDLHLRSCDIKTFNGRSLSGFTKLQYLDLAYNPIKWLNDLSSRTLTKLDLSYCDLDSMNPYALTNLPSLISLKLSGNSQFAINYGNLTSGSLQIFEASYCSLTTPGLYGLPNLTYANLRGNKIEILKERTFVKNKVLVELDLSANEIKQIHPQAFIAARQLAFVNLSSNSIKGNLPWNTFSTNYNLKVLDLSASGLETVGNLSILGLEYLDLSQCAIKEIRKDSLTGLPWLMHLNLSYNPLQKIPDDIQSWFLRTLDLSYCRLTSITNETFWRFPEIEVINFTGNRFINPFKTWMFDYNDRLKQLKLSDNPWICDCHSQDFKALWDFLYSKITRSEERNLKCMSPDNLSGKSWISACYDEWYPSIEPGNTGYGMTHYGSVLIIMVIIIAGIFAVIGAIKHGIKKRMKEEEEQMEREIGHRMETNSRVVYQTRETFSFEESDEVELRSRRPPERGRSDSQLTQPPTYEEAIQMLSASREDVVGREDVAGGSGQHQEDSDDDEDEDMPGESYSIGSELSDDDDDYVPKTVNNRK